MSVSKWTSCGAVLVPYPNPVLVQTRQVWRGAWAKSHPEAQDQITQAEKVRPEGEAQQPQAVFETQTQHIPWDSTEPRAKCWDMS